MLRHFAFVALLSIFTLLPSSNGWSHPGHGTSPEGPVHYLTEPIHVFPLMAFALLISLTIICWGATKMRRSGQGEW